MWGETPTTNTPTRRTWLWGRRAWRRLRFGGASLRLTCTRVFCSAAPCGLFSDNFNLKWSKELTCTMIHPKYFINLSSSFYSWYIFMQFQVSWPDLFVIFCQFKNTLQKIANKITAAFGHTAVKTFKSFCFQCYQNNVFIHKFACTFKPIQLNKFI